MSSISSSSSRITPSIFIEGEPILKHTLSDLIMRLERLRVLNLESRQEQQERWESELAIQRQLNEGVAISREDESRLNEMGYGISKNPHTIERFRRFQFNPFPALAETIRAATVEGGLLLDRYKAYRPGPAPSPQLAISKDQRSAKGYGEIFKFFEQQTTEKKEIAETVASCIELFHRYSEEKLFGNHPLILIDLGCGNGRQSAELAIELHSKHLTEQLQIIGVDNMPDCIAECRQQPLFASQATSHIRSKFVIHSIMESPPPSIREKAQIVVLSHVYLNQPNMDILLNQLKYWCDENAMVVFVHNEEETDGVVLAKQHPSFIRGFSFSNIRSHVQKKLQEQGFAVQAVVKESHLYFPPLTQEIEKMICSIKQGDYENDYTDEWAAHSPEWAIHLKDFRTYKALMEFYASSPLEAMTVQDREAYLTALKERFDYNRGIEQSSRCFLKIVNQITFACPNKGTFRFSLRRGVHSLNESRLVSRVPQILDIPTSNPSSLDPEFISRPEAIKELSEKMTQYRRCIVTGVRGVGKSILIREFVRQHQSEYQRCFFIPSQTRLAVAEGCKTISDKLNLPLPDEQIKDELEDEGVLRFRSYLRREGNDLLIFDRLDSKETWEFITKTLKINETSLPFIITTIDPSICNNNLYPPDLITLERYSKKEEKYLFHSLSLEKLTNSLLSIPPSSRRELVKLQKDIITKIEHNPLAIRLARNFILKFCNLSPNQTIDPSSDGRVLDQVIDALTFLKKRLSGMPTGEASSLSLPVELLSSPSSSSSSSSSSFSSSSSIDPPLEHPQSRSRDALLQEQAIVWMIRIAIDRIKGENAEYFLSDLPLFLAILSPASISEEFLELFYPREKLAHMLAELQDYGFIEKNRPIFTGLSQPIEEEEGGKPEKKYLMNPVLASLIHESSKTLSSFRDRMVPAILSTIDDYLQNSFKGFEPDNLLDSRDEFPQKHKIHINAMINFTIQTRFREHKKGSTSLELLAPKLVWRHHFFEGRFSNAKGIAKNLVTILPNNSNEKALFLDLLGLSYDRLGKHEKGKDRKERALKIRSNLTPDSEEVARSLNNLGFTYQALSDNPLNSASETEKYRFQALNAKYSAFCIRAAEFLSESSIEEINAFTNRRDSDSEISEPSIKLSEAEINRSNEIIGECLINIFERLENNTEMLDQSSATSSTHSPTSEQSKLKLKLAGIAYCAHNVALSLQEMGKIKQALTFHLSAQKIWEVTLRENHSFTIDEYYNIGCCQEVLEQYQKAIESYNKALKLSKKHQASNHQRIAKYRQRLGHNYRTVGEYNKAYKNYQKCLDLRLSMSRGKDMNNLQDIEKIGLAQGYENIGSLYHDSRNYRKAFAYFQRAAQILNLLKHPNTLAVVRNSLRIGTLQHNLSYSQTACNLSKITLARAFQILSNIPRYKQGLEEARTLHAFGNLYFCKGEYKKAWDFQGTALKRSNQKDTSFRAVCFSDLGLSCMQLGEYNIAVEYQMEALKLQYQILGLEKLIPFGEEHVEVSFLEDNVKLNHLKLATFYERLGLANAKLGCYTKALGAQKYSYQMRIALLDQWPINLKANYFDLAKNLTYIAAVEMKLKRYQSAFIHLNLAFKLASEDLYDKHPDMAIIYEHFGILYEKVGQYEEALKNQKIALKIRKKCYCANHPSIAESLKSVGFLALKLETHAKKAKEKSELKEEAHNCLTDSKKRFENLLLGQENTLTGAFSSSSSSTEDVSSARNLTHLEKKDLVDKESLSHLITVSYYLGLYHLNIEKKKDSALSHFLQSLDYIESLLEGPHEYYAEICYQIGNLQQPSQTPQWVERGLSVAEKQGSTGDGVVSCIQGLSLLSQIYDRGPDQEKVIQIQKQLFQIYNDHVLLPSPLTWSKLDISETDREIPIKTVCKLVNIKHLPVLAVEPKEDQLLNLFSPSHFSLDSHFHPLLSSSISSRQIVESRQTVKPFETMVYASMIDFLIQSINIDLSVYQSEIDLIFKSVRNRNNLKERLDQIRGFHSHIVTQLMDNPEDLKNADNIIQSIERIEKICENPTTFSFKDSTEKLAVFLNSIPKTYQRLKSTLSTFIESQTSEIISYEPERKVLAQLEELQKDLKKAENPFCNFLQVLAKKTARLEKERVHIVYFVTIQEQNDEIASQQRTVLGTLKEQLNQVGFLNVDIDIQLAPLSGNLEEELRKMNGKTVLISSQSIEQKKGWVNHLYKLIRTPSPDRTFLTTKIGEWNEKEGYLENFQKLFIELLGLKHNENSSYVNHLWEKIIKNKKNDP
jgi:tetratricopeptide (TPR) repeat protein